MHLYILICLEMITLIDIILEVIVYCGHIMLVGGWTAVRDLAEALSSLGGRL